MNFIKNWILNRKFVKYYIANVIRDAEVSFATKNFALAQKDILETMRDDLDKQAQELADNKLASLLSVIDPRAIVRYDKVLKAIYIGGERAQEARLSNLKAEAEFFVQSELWKLLYETPKELAQRAMFIEGDNMEAQMKKGRSILFTLATQKEIVELFKTIK